MILSVTVQLTNFLGSFVIIYYYYYFLGKH